MEIREPAPENFLYSLWVNEKFQKPLCTVNGQKIEVIFKGIRNMDSGPDFRNATIVINGQMKVGDIEIHPVAADWYHHGHHKDARYNNVVLHVVTMDVSPSFQTQRQDGETIPALNLDEFLEEPSERLAEDEKNRCISNEQEGECYLRSQEIAEKLRIIELAGDERLKVKSERFHEERHTDSWDQIFYRGFAEALGYSKNQIPFRNLANQIPVIEIWRSIREVQPKLAEIRAQAYLFGAAGLLACKDIHIEKSNKSEAQEYIESLQSEWALFPYIRKIDPLDPIEWLFFRLRPHNFPTRRIAGLAVLVTRFSIVGFMDGFVKVFNSFYDQIHRIYRELQKLLIVPAENYWVHYNTFDLSQVNKLSKAHPRLIGKDRAAEMVINIVLPALLANTEETGDSRLKNTIRQMFAQSPPLAENTITRHMKQLLFEDKNSLNIDTVRKQQGIIQLYKSMCISGDCDRCICYYK